MSSTVITASYNDAISVSFRSDAWFNATSVATSFGKTPKDWLRTDDTKDYIQSIGRICLVDENQLVSKKAGNPEHGGGTWFHPKLAIPFARWLNPDFGVWCDMQIEKILNRQNGLKELPSSTITASEQQTLSEIVDRRARDYGTMIGKAKAEIWSRLHRKFRIARYQQLPREQLSDAIAYVMGMEVKTPPKLPYSAPLSVWKLSNQVGATAWLTYPELEKVDEAMRPMAVLLRQLHDDGCDVAGAKAEYTAIKTLLRYYYWRLDALAEIFNRMDQYGHRVNQH